LKALDNSEDDLRLRCLWPAFTLKEPHERGKLPTQFSKQGRGAAEVMAARLGDVLYWAGCLIGGLLVINGIWPYVETQRYHSDMLWVVGAGVVCWLIGRACRYVLAGR
jgi:hypothetical protein